jgi:hypothetical protein
VAMGGEESDQKAQSLKERRSGLAAAASALFPLSCSVGQVFPTTLE